SFSLLPILYQTPSFSRTTSDVVRRRVVFILRRWLECAPSDFEDPLIRATFTRFVERDLRKRGPALEEHAAGLTRLLAPPPLTESASSSSSSSSSWSSSGGSSASDPWSCSSSARSSAEEMVVAFSYLNIPIAKLEVLAVDPSVLAEQLTLLDYALFKRVSMV